MVDYAGHVAKAKMPCLVTLFGLPSSRPWPGRSAGSSPRHWPKYPCSHPGPKLSLYKGLSVISQAAALVPYRYVN